MKKPEIVCLMGKAGDLIAMLPAFKKMSERDDVKPIVMVSSEFSQVLEGVSYVSPWIVPLHWENDIERAREAAEVHFHRAIVPQWWNDSVRLADHNLREQRNGGEGAIVHVDGVALNIDFEREPNYVASMWRTCGFGYKEMLAEPVLFDKRRQVEENNLCATWLHIKKPTVLFNFTGTSSPFPFQTELFTVMREFKDQINFVNLGEIKSGRIYDLLGLYDNSIGLITIDTATLHLAAASKVPYIGLTKEGWSGSVCKGNCVLTFKYGETVSRLEAVRKTLTTWVRQHSPKHKIDRNDPPSVTAQTLWPCKILETPREHGDFFNPGLVTVNGQDYLFARRCFTPTGGQFSKNEINIFRLKGNTMEPHVTFQPITHFEGEHFEDPRVFMDGGMIYLSCCNFVWNSNNKSTYTHQVMFMLDQDFNCKRRFDTEFIGNGKSLALNLRNEKNWLWFYHQHQPHLIYATEPHLVAKFLPDCQTMHKPEESQYLQQPDYGWHYGEMRGGTPPIRIGDEYWSFFHSSLPAPEHNSRRYHMGVYAFEAKAPFRPTRITREPLLSGSRHDRRKPGGPLVVFPCGSKLDNGTWTVSFGVNDLDCALIEIPHNELLPLMRNL